MKDYYKILGVSKDATEDQLKKAYRHLAMKYHPDRNRDDPKTAEEKFKEVKEAYETLSDPQKRQMVDQGIDPNDAQAGGFGGGGGVGWDGSTPVSSESAPFASGGGGMGFGGEVAFLGEARFAAVHVLVDDAREQERGGTESGLLSDRIGERCCWGKLFLVVDEGDDALFHQDVCPADVAVGNVDDVFEVMLVRAHSLENGCHGFEEGSKFMAWDTS